MIMPYCKRDQGSALMHKFTWKGKGWVPGGRGKHCGEKGRDVIEWKGPANLLMDGMHQLCSSSYN